MRVATAMRGVFLALLILCGLSAVPAHAVIIASGDGSGNTSAPPDDPGWSHVGRKVSPGLTVVYLGNRWVITADHVGEGDVILNGTTYNAVVGSEIQLNNGDSTFADVALFQIQQDPGLPDLPISLVTPPPGADAILIGKGRNRGAATSWMGIDGWNWGAGSVMRWGTNHIAGGPVLVPLAGRQTQSIWTVFDPLGSEHEGVVAEGDSGGALFVQEGSLWVLAGILYAAGSHEGQPAQTALYGNETVAADIASYRDQIVDIVWPGPECSNGIDDDGDGMFDHPADPGCFAATSDNESPQCQDGKNNDPAQDGLIDFDGGLSALGYVATAPDPQCVPQGTPKPWKNKERTGCGLGFELALIMSVLARRRSRRTASRRFNR